MRKYPDVSELLARKEARRQRLAKLPVSQKMEIANRLRKLSDEIRSAVNASRQSSLKQDRSTMAGKKSKKK